jgi:hypothetical protein
MFLCFFRFCVFALQVGKRHVQRLVAEPDSDGPYRYSNLRLTCALPTIHELAYC